MAPTTESSTKQRSWLPGALAASMALSALACQRASADTRFESPPKGDMAEETPSPAPYQNDFVVFLEACDASGAVPLDAKQFALADDEDNVLRIYDAERGGAPLRRLNPAAHLNLRGKNPESDLEAASYIGETAYWLASHGRNKRGRVKPERLMFFSTRVPSVDEELQVIGSPYRHLLDDLIADPRLAKFDLAGAASLPPKAEGGLNIEGLTAMPDGALLLGFRSPVPNARALMVALLNPNEIPHGTRATLGDPILLDLEGLGVRALSWWKGRYLIIAGPHDYGESRLYSWLGPGHGAELVERDMQGLNPEAFFTPEDRDAILLLSDDGTQLVGDTACKSAPADAKRFRGRWVRPAYASRE